MARTMNYDLLNRLLQALRPRVDPGGAAVLADRELLERFTARGDQAAFELLLWRHGPMVLALCQRMLSHEQDVEDAFQATFLTLVRKGRSITAGEAVGSWLFRVAYRVALRSRTERARQSRRERTGVDGLDAPARSEPAPDDLWGTLVGEINRLPARERAAFVLCCLEGKTGEEAARQLGCPAGTVSSRLTGARKRLRSRLLRRGLALSAGTFALATAEDVGASALASRIDSTLIAVQRFAAGEAPGGALSGQAVALARGVLRAMFLKNLRTVALMFLVTAALATGGILFHRGLEAAPPTPAANERGPAEAAAPDGKAIAVQLFHPAAGGLDVTIAQPGSVEAFEVGYIFPIVAGVLKGQTVDLGDPVKKGQLLAEIDAPLLELEEQQAASAVRQARAQVQEAESRVATAKAEVKMAESGVQQRQADLEGARALVPFRTAELGRIDALRKSNVVDAQTVDEKRAALGVAKSQVTGAVAALDSAKALLVIQQTKVGQAEAAVAIAQANAATADVALAKARYSRSLTRLVSPLDGVVTQRATRNGEYVRPSESGNRYPLLTVQQTDKVRVVVQVPELDSTFCRTGDPVELSFLALPGVRFPGCRVSRIGFVEDLPSRSMRVEIDVLNPKQILRPGMYANAEVHAYKGPASAVHVPASCLVRSPEGESAVYVVCASKARRTAVRTGVEHSGEVEILSGLEAGDVVVADPAELKGDVVRVKVEDRPKRP